MRALGYARLRLLLAVFAALTILGLFAFESCRIAHYVLEPNCPARESGNPADCAFCTQFELVPAELAPEAILPDLSEIIGIAAETRALCRPEEHRLTPRGRSPPTRS
jgi:hypothetical protein